jgi:hypothetical protein
MATTKSKSSKITAEFDFDRSTKNTHRFTENGTEHIGTLYVQKNSLPAEIGEGSTLSVVITVTE